MVPHAEVPVTRIACAGVRRTHSDYLASGAHDTVWLDYQLVHDTVWLDYQLVHDTVWLDYQFWVCMIHVVRLPASGVHDTVWLDYQLWECMIQCS